MELNDFLFNLIKVELHVHIEGTLEPEMVFNKAIKNNVTLQYKNIAELKKAYKFNNLADFLQLYYDNMRVLKDKTDFYDLTWAYLQKVHDHNVHHVELFFDPQPHLKNNVKFGDIVLGINQALSEAQDKWNLSSCLIMSFLKDEPVASALKILDLAKDFIKDNKIHGIGLDSSESENWVTKFIPVFEKARTLKLHTVSHSGEEKNDQSVNHVLDMLKPERIDHGLQTAASPEILKRLNKDDIHLTLCPLSNQALQACSDLNDYPIKTFLQQNVSFSINSDDPAYVGGYINHNYLAIQKIFNLTKGEWQTVTINSIKATFLSATEKELLIKKVLLS